MGKREMIQPAASSLRVMMAGCLAFAAAGCIPPRVPDPMELYQSYQVPVAETRDLSKRVVKVSLGEQRAYLTEGGRVVMVMPVTVGRAGKPTPEGAFRIRRKIERHRSPTYGFAVRGSEIRRAKSDQVPGGWRYVGMPLPYWCEIAPGVGFHTGWLRHQPASQGTIRMHQNLAPVFFDLVDVGTPVIIAVSHPEDQDHAFIPLPPDSGPIPPLPDAFYLGDGFFEIARKPSR